MMAAGCFGVFPDMILLMQKLFAPGCLACMSLVSLTKVSHLGRAANL